MQRKHQPPPLPRQPVLASVSQPTGSSDTSASPRSVEYLYAATRQEIARYSNLDWAVMAQGFALLTGILLLQQQDSLLQGLLPKVLLFTLLLFVILFFIYTRLFIHHRLTQERELQRQIEEQWKKLGHFHFLSGNDTLHCDRHNGRIGKSHRTVFAYAQCFLLILYGVYIAVRIFQTILLPAAP